MWNCMYFFKRLGVILFFFPTGIFPIFQGDIAGYERILSVYRTKTINRTKDSTSNQHNGKISIQFMDKDNKEEREQVKRLFLDEDIARWIDYSQNPVGKRLIAKTVDGKVVGILDFIPKDDHVWIGTIAVHPHYRRLGVAKSLIQEVERLHKNNENIKELKLVVSTRNSSAMAAYDKLGFHK